MRVPPFRGIPLALFLLLAVLPASSEEPPVVVSGEIVETSCYIRSGAKGESHRKCAELCARSGIPLALLDESNDTLIWLAAEDHRSTPTKLLEKHIARRVKITGRYAERSGARLLIIQSVEPLDR